jgi:hypothetical protein
MATPVAGMAPMPSQPMSTPSHETATMVVNPQASPLVDTNKLRSLGAKLESDFRSYESHRRDAEMRWARNLRQFLGEYDPELLKMLDKNRSQAYPRITRVKCISMLSRLMNLLFPTSEKNWGITASPVPNLSVEDLTTVLQQVQAPMLAPQEPGQPPPPPLTSEAIERAVLDFARVRASKLETEIEDQLAEIGGNRNLNYVALCRRVLLSGIMYGAGVVKGPFVREQAQRCWLPQPGPAGMLYVPEQKIAMRPQLEFVSLWDYYPDMSAKNIHQMDGQFQRMVLSKSQLRELADNPEFFSETILQILEQMPQGNYKEKTFESELRVIGVHSNINPNLGRKYEVLVWEGFVASDYLEAAGITLPNGIKDMADASVWMLNGQIIRADLSPWAELEPDQRVQMYHHFIFEEDDSSLMGNGLPNIMRDSQMSICSAARMTMDNGSVVCGPNMEVNRDLLVMGQDEQSIQPYKVWLREGIGVEAQWPAVRNIQIDSHLPDLQNIIKMFMEFADQETFVNPATGGDMQKGPSEPFRTAAGASMIQGMAALPFKDVVRNFDTFTISVMNALILFNKHFNTKQEVQGDFTPIARGSSSLIAKEVRGMAYDQLAATLQPEERAYIKWHAMLAERLAVRDIDVTRVLCTEAEAREIDQAMAQKNAEQQAQMTELLRAEVRKLLADATKSLTQAGSNDAKGEAATYNAILAGLEHGVAPVDIHAARAGAPVPPAIAREFQRNAGNGPEKVNGAKAG